MNKLIRGKCAVIASHYGEAPQQRMMMEECAELTQAICKLSRVKADDKDDARRNYIEELADVTIMAEQLYLLLDDKERQFLHNTLRFKLRRQFDRIEREEDPKDGQED